MTHAPRLETTRLVLRAHRQDDLAPMLALWSNAEAVRFITRAPQSEVDVWQRLLRYAGMWPILGYGFWALEDRATGEWLGDAGLLDGRRGLAGLAGIPEAGWALSPSASGRGLATEAMTAVLRWADSHLEAPRVGCIISPDNQASLRVARKCHFVEADRVTHDGSPLLLLHRARRSAA